MLAALPNRSRKQLDFIEEFGWANWSDKRHSSWFKGYLIYEGQIREGVDAARFLSDQIESFEERSLPEFLRKLDGHFAIAMTVGDWLFASVDRIRTIPLFYFWDGKRFVIGSHAGRLAQKFELSLQGIDPDGALAVAMAGYTIGGRTLYRSLKQLQAGESIVLAGNRPKVSPYYYYRAWDGANTDLDILRNNLREVTLEILERMVKGVNGRPIVLPLSGGLDSRLILSGIAELGYRNVRCYAYGQPRNFEAKLSQRIAKHLGYKWTFIPYTQESQRRVFEKSLHKDFITYGDTCASVPFEQDFYAVRRLRESGWAPEDSVFVNGQSGDFITGNHIPETLWCPKPDLTPEERERHVIDALIAKHFSLWESLKTPGNIERLSGLFRELWEKIGVTFEETNSDYGFYECAEFHNRQANYVTTGQRIYEFFGFDWRLPLWDALYIDFWEKAPLRAKIRQSLYKTFLVRENWGGVWKGWEAKQDIIPKWIIPVRHVLRALHAPLGRERWHRLERQYLDYWMDILCNYAIVAYRRVAMDRRGFRNAVSWHAEAYLEEKGIHLDRFVN
jgi:asparagine synthase (glutamine-hydrolysing)